MCGFLIMWIRTFDQTFIDKYVFLVKFVYLDVEIPFVTENLRGARKGPLKRFHRNSKKRECGNAWVVKTIVSTELKLCKYGLLLHY